MNTQIKEFSRTHTWIYQMKNSKGLDSLDNYAGSFERADWVVSVGRNRDSDTLAESNFSVALERLGGESKNVEVCRFGHWACGWFELIMINPKSLKHVKIALEIHESLERYPVLDEFDYFDRENEYHTEFADDSKADLAEALSKHFGIKNGPKLVDIAFMLNMECQRYYGDDVCVNIYDCRTPDLDDIKQLDTCIEQVGDNYNDYNKSKVFKQLRAAVLKQIESLKAGS